MIFEHDQRLGGSPGQQREIRKLGGLFRLVVEGDHFPRGYGMAWRDWQSFRVWACPVPLNLAVAAVRWLWFSLVHGLRPHAFELAVIEEVARRQRVWDEAVQRAHQARDEALAKAQFMEVLAWEAGKQAVEMRQRIAELEGRTVH